MDETPHLGLEEIRPHDVITIDFDGNKLAGELPRHSEFPIHTEIYRQRADVQCVIHTHPPYATAFSAVDEPLRPVNHEGTLFAPTLPRFVQTSDLIVTPALGQAVARALAEHNALLLKNHGIVVVGSSVEEACVTALCWKKPPTCSCSPGNMATSSGLLTLRPCRKRRASIKRKRSSGCGTIFCAS